MGRDRAVVLCGGGSCRRKQAAAYESLASELHEAGVPVAEVRCLGSCAGPTAVLVVGGSPVAFERLRKPGAQKDLVALALRRTAAPSARLAKRVVKGARRRKLEARLARRGKA